MISPSSSRPPVAWLALLCAACGGGAFEASAASDGGARRHDAGALDAHAVDAELGDDGGSADAASSDGGPEALDATADAAPPPEGSVSDGSAGPTYTIGGNVSGLLTSETLGLQDNGTDTLYVTSNGAFTFTLPLPHGAQYAVTISHTPIGRSCSVANAAGVVAYSNVTDVYVTCQ